MSRVIRRSNRWFTAELNWLWSVVSQRGHNVRSNISSDLWSFGGFSSVGVKTLFICGIVEIPPEICVVWINCRFSCRLRWQSSRSSHRPGQASSPPLTLKQHRGRLHHHSPNGLDRWSQVSCVLKTTSIWSIASFWTRLLGSATFLISLWAGGGTMMSEPAFLLVRVTVTNTAGSGLVWQQTPLILYDMTAAAVAISLSLALKTRCTRRSGRVRTVWQCLLSLHKEICRLKLSNFSQWTNERTPAESQCEAESLRPRPGLQLLQLHNSSNNLSQLFSQWSVNIREAGARQQLKSWLSISHAVKPRQ